MANVQGLDLTGVDLVLSTTRNVRKRLDPTRPIPHDLLQECIQLALQAPTGENTQAWRFLVVTDPDKRRKLGEVYAAAAQVCAEGGPDLASVGLEFGSNYPEGDPRTERNGGVIESGMHLVQHLGEVPALVVVCIEGRVDHVKEYAGFLNASFYGSIIPAAWSLMLALRSRGLVSAYTTLHLVSEDEAAAVLGIPRNVTQVALLPVAYPVGDEFHPAKRLPVQEVTYWDTWGTKQA